MAVRNWWLEADIDGRKTKLSGGPRSKDGGFSLILYQRDKGEIRKVLGIGGMVDKNGDLVLNIGGIANKYFKTER